MFINLLDTDLQARIAKAENYDFDVKNTLEMLLEKGPVAYNRIWKIGNWSDTMEKTYYFIRTKIMSQMTLNFGGTF